MTRLARDRGTHLSRAEIAVETLRQFDEGAAEPSIRSLASALSVQPSAIYHHFGSRAEIVAAAADLVWAEIPSATIDALGDPFAADPVEVLVTSGLATRRAFLRHHRIAPSLAAIPEPDAQRAMTLVVVANVFERLGLRGDDAAAAFHAYASFVVGTALFAAGRRGAEERETDAATQAFVTEQLEGDATRAALDAVMTVSRTDPARDEDLYVQGLRRLIAGLVAG